MESDVVEEEKVENSAEKNEKRPKEFGGTNAIR